MTEKEYHAAHKELYNNYKKQEKALHREYYLSIAEAKVGDVVEDKDGLKIVVTAIETRVSGSTPYWFSGFVLKKDGTRRADNKTESIFPHYIKQVYKAEQSQSL